VLAVEDIQLSDTKTLLFQTPSCPIATEKERVRASIIIQENEFSHPPIDVPFCYFSFAFHHQKPFLIIRR
jgi:hypothetical protein